MTPDFRVPWKSKTGDAEDQDAEDQDAEDQDTEEPAETEKSEPKDNERRVGIPGVPREAADPAEQERREDTLRSRHVPGGAWLTKGDGRKEEFSLKTPTGRDARGTPKTESEDPQVLGTREEGGNQTPKTSACRHDQ
ncbi:hypothetical protein NDU88_007115 [Pleurodeles waltl]|uniref:Uncharacterized protein n=1 Tax=Pleurodeles waltl TaxID=8319 RepID=A0AAV7RTU9_PLEWA|nr:hypothetical protein NDU88_007115 [Pleurodeles waltl]